MKKIAIINRACYERKSAHTARAISDGLAKLGADIKFTEHRGHAEEIAKNSRGYDIIIVAGGDGSLSEVINGMDLGSQALALLPIGTGNSLANDLGIKNVRDAMDTIKANRYDKIDLLKCDFESKNSRFERYVATTSGAGFAEAVVSFGKRYLKIAGPSCYALSACFKAFLQRALSAKIKVNGSDPKEIIFTSFFVNNTMHSAGMCIFPDARLHDSMFDFFFAKTNVFTQYLWNIGISTKTYICCSGRNTANRLRIMLNKPASFMLDGEIFDSVEDIEYSVMPAKLTILH